jgi:deoxycytidine triphosphate deaminase
MNPKINGWIASVSHNYDLIVPFDQKRLGPSNYTMSVGLWFAPIKQSSIFDLNDLSTDNIWSPIAEDSIVLHQGEMVKIFTKETLNIPEMRVTALATLDKRWADVGVIAPSFWVYYGQKGPLWFVLQNTGEFQIILRRGDPVLDLTFFVLNETPISLD